MKYDLIKIQKRLEKKLTPERYQHTISVMYTCAALAMRYGCDIEKALTAGLLHDCAKCIPNDKKLKICKKNGIAVSRTEHENPFLLHAKVGEYLAREKYGIEDEEILGAIRYHTTGRADMTLLEKITYIADYIEPWRNKAPNLEVIREAAFSDIDRAIYVIFRDTLQYLQHTGNEIDQTTRTAYEYYYQLHQKRLEQQPDKGIS